jgi:hypothetical protein
MGFAYRRHSWRITMVWPPLGIKTPAAAWIAAAPGQAVADGMATPPDIIQITWHKRYHCPETTR